jgi:hypothetical protein
MKSSIYLFFQKTRDIKKHDKGTKKWQSVKKHIKGCWQGC